MKKTIIYLTVILTTTLFIRCQKEVSNHSKSLPLNDALSDLYQEMPLGQYGNISLIHDDILVFENSEHYFSTLDELTNLYESWSNLFFNEYGVEDETALDSIISSMKFDDCIPLELFELEMGNHQNNLRYLCKLAENRWLNSTSTTSPPEDSIINNPIEQTLYSQHHEVCINNIIYQFRPNGYCVLIPISLISYLEEIREIQNINTLDSLVSTIPDIILKRCKDACYKSTHYKTGEISHTTRNGKFFTWSFRYAPNVFDSRTRASITMKNYKTVNGHKRWDYAICAIGESSKAYSYKIATEECTSSIGPNSTLGNANKYHLKTRIDYSMVLSHIDSGHSITIGPITINIPEYIEELHIDPDESYLYCRHNGWTFNINVGNGSY